MIRIICLPAALLLACVGEISAPVQVVLRPLRAGDDEGEGEDHGEAEEEGEEEHRRPPVAHPGESPLAALLLQFCRSRGRLRPVSRRLQRGALGGLVCGLHRGTFTASPACRAETGSGVRTQNQEETLKLSHRLNVLKTWWWQHHVRGRWMDVKKTC